MSAFHKKCECCFFTGFWSYERYQVIGENYWNILLFCRGRYSMRVKLRGIGCKMLFMVRAKNPVSKSSV